MPHYGWLRAHLVSLAGTFWGVGGLGLVSGCQPVWPLWV